MNNTDSKTSITTIILCFLIAVAEGFDLQAPGLAAQGISAAFELNRFQIGWFFSIGLLAMLPAAIVGGRVSDNYGRKRVLVVAVIIFSVSSIITALCESYYGLLAARFMTGIGLGAALPNLIALSSDAVGPSRKGAAVSAMYCGVPIGAVTAALLGVAQLSESWKFLFYVGGVGPLLLVPFIIWLLPKSRVNAASSGKTKPPIKVLFNDSKWKDTLLLWSGFFFTMMVAYILVNWMPSLLIAQGLSSKEMNYVVMIMHMGSAVGTVMIGNILDRAPLWVVPAIVYSGILLALTGLYYSDSMSSILWASFIAGMFTVGGQGVLFALAPLFYPMSIRVTGVSGAISVGRLGAMSGPVIIGQFLAMGGGGTASVMLACAPAIVIAAGSLLYLSKRYYRASEI
ncbi:3-(3-hydroxy-phenyl)propionate transporter MhpT [Stutzerimonas stutzeri]|uniref:3-(3-hydroxy-phenyl)propionate transporter MhpT n=1 Tax=Stutzerimonas stutzeri TaxID=316 RepID=A0A6I6LJX3_STUST|nr:3-(3-hydroxy-phenyl)propionate transporter MhpT [Stutzerimonas stutzeri]QGZ31179.1 3-(3-hydroxy-phenyl)propionate transporter MhpT [Stutzerimonas stutzeri]